jgi:two-component system KDP operon response regulator KdpE
VDDEPRIVELMRLNFELEGFRVIEANDGRQALRLVESHTPDLVVLDLVMPRLNGLETLAQMRALSSVPVIMVSVDTDEERIARGRELGVNDWIRKPFSPRDLIARVKKLLDRAYPRADGSVDEEQQPSS